MKRRRRRKLIQNSRKGTIQTGDISFPSKNLRGPSYFVESARAGGGQINGWWQQKTTSNGKL